MRHPPARVKTMCLVEWNGGRNRRVQDHMAVEEPLEIRVGGAPVAGASTSSGFSGISMPRRAAACAAAGVPIVASVSAPSSLAVDLACEHDLTLIGFLGERFIVYSGGQRITNRESLNRCVRTACRRRASTIQGFKIQGSVISDY